MNQPQTDGRRARFLPPAHRALLTVLAVTSMVAADPALARKAKHGLSPGIHLAARAQAAAQAAAHASPRAAPVAPEVVRPMPHPRRHGARGSAVGR